MILIALLFSLASENLAIDRLQKIAEIGRRFKPGAFNEPDTDSAL